MNQTEISIFTNALKKYYQINTKLPMEIETAYLYEHRNLPLLDYTATIELTGAIEGVAYFSAPHNMLLQTLILAEDRRNSKEALLELLSNISKSVAKNIVRGFGNTLQVTRIGNPKTTVTSHAERPYMIKLNWRNQEALLILDFTKKHI